MHKVQRPSERSQSAAQTASLFPALDDVAVQLFIDHAASKLRTAPAVVRVEVKAMVPSGPPLGELGEDEKVQCGGGGVCSIRSSPVGTISNEKKT